MADEPTDRDPDDDLETGRLDELELERTPRLPGDEKRSRADVPRERGLPYLLVALALLGSALLAAMLFLFRTPAGPRASAAAPGPDVAPGATISSPAPTAPLPSLDDSDAFARGLAATLSSHPELAKWLGRNALVRTVAAVVTNVADGESPRPHLEFLAPARPFRGVARSRGRLAADPAGFQSYDTFGDVVASIDAPGAAAAYRSIEPLFDEAHRELGHPEGRFRRSLDRAIAALLATPVPPEDAELVAHATMLRYADPALEALTPAQKQLLRAGPRNVRLLQAKLRELQAALGPEPAP
jgi:hypothetical protein